MATLRDVANQAGVSISTVSRALYGSRRRPTAQKKQERILAVARDLNYFPAESARRIGSQMSDAKTARVLNIGLVVGATSYKFADPFWTPVLAGIDRETTRQGHHLRFTFTLDDLTHSHQRELLTRNHVDGLVIVGGHDSLVVLDSLSDWLHVDGARARTVIIEGGDDRLYRNSPLQYDVVTCDKRYSIYQLINHLVSLGHRRLAFLGPNVDHDDRGAAFVQALAFHNIPFDPDLYVESPWTTEEAYPAAQRLLAGGKPIDAVVCGCDAIAVSMMRVAREAGMRLPEDLAIAGFDDIEFAQHMHPALTTIRVEKELLGELAVRKLTERLQRPDLLPILQITPDTLVIRESCGERLAR